jgi:hypothetical protein
MQISSKKLKDIAEHASNPLAKSILNLVLPAFEDIEALDARVKALESKPRSHRVVESPPFNLPSDWEVESPVQREGLTEEERQTIAFLRAEGPTASENYLIRIIDRLTSPPEKPTPVPTQGGFWCDNKASGTPCALCGGDVVEFSVPNEMWNKIVRDGGPESRHEYLCVTCFHKLMQKQLLPAVEPSAEAVADKFFESGSYRHQKLVEALTVFARSKSERIRELEALLKEAKDSMGQHMGHWDNKGTRGDNCPVCIRQREVGEKIRQLIQPEGKK